MMNPQAVTVGARVARRLNPILLLAARRSPDPTSFFGGILATVAGGVSGVVGPQTTAELLRICIGRLEQKPQLELPPGARLAIASATAAGNIDSLAAQASGAAANDEALVYSAIQGANDDQLEAMRRVLAVVSAKAGIESDELIKILDDALAEIRAGREALHVQR